MLLTWQNSGGVNSLLNTAEFILPLWDSGAGAVNTALWRGTGSATFTRATTATTVDSTGLIVSVASGVARSYYDPSTLEYRGYLAEGARTNLCLQSADFATTWTTSNAGSGSLPVITVNQATAPDGTLSADEIVFSAPGGADQSFVNQTIATSAASVYSGYLYFKAKTASDVGKIILVRGAAGTGYTQITLTSSWQRAGSVETAALASSTFQFGLRPAIAGSSGTVSCYVWGGQFELGSFPSSYIPTTTAAVTRNADVLTYTFAGNADATVGTAYVEVSSQWSTSPVAYALGFGLNGLFRVNAEAATNFRINDGTNTATKSGLSSLATGVRKRAGSWGAAGLLVTGDGLAAASGTFDGNTENTAITIGSNGAGSANFWFGTIKNVRIFQAQFTASQLQAITS